MPDLQTALAALKLPAHFDDDNMVAAPDAAQEIKTISENYTMSKRATVLEVIRDNPGIQRQRLAIVAKARGVGVSSSLAYISQLVRSGDVIADGEPGSRRFRINDGSQVPATPRPYRRKVKAVAKAPKAPKVALAPTVGAVNVNNLTVMQAKELYEQLKTIFG
jgi:hypothetical protein